MSPERDEERNMREQRKREFDVHSLSTHVLFGDTDRWPCNELAMTSHSYIVIYKICLAVIEGISST